jgi:hypothetical protein
VSCKRLWQIGMEHAGDDDAGGYADDEAPVPTTGEGGGAAAAGPGLCSWFRDDAQVPLREGATGIWVSVFGEGGAAGQVLLSISRGQREMPPAEGAGAPGEVDAAGLARGGTLKVSACQAYDYLLMAALRAQMCDEKRLEVGGEWAWLLTAFAGHYGVRSNYAIMSHLRWVLKPGVASVSRTCFELLARQLRPLLAQEAMGGSLTQQEVRGWLGAALGLHQLGPENGVSNPLRPCSSAAISPQSRTKRAPPTPNPATLPPPPLPSPPSRPPCCPASSATPRSC